MFQPMLKTVALGALTLSLAACIHTQEEVDKKTGTKTTSVSITGCGNPSQRITRVEFKGDKKPVLYASTGQDPCNVALGAAIGAAGNVLSSAVLPSGGDIINSVGSSSGSLSQTNTQVGIGIKH